MNVFFILLKYKFYLIYAGFSYIWLKNVYGFYSFLLKKWGKASLLGPANA